MDWSQVSQQGRRRGKTTALVAIVREQNGVLVCHSKERAHQVCVEHKVQTLSIEESDKIKQWNPEVPIYFEPEAVAFICDYYRSREIIYAETVDHLKRIIRAEKALRIEDNNRSQNRIDRLKTKLINLDRKFNP